MVTRRPVELTLVHTPESELEYGEFPQLGLGKVSWERIKKTLVDLNLAVSPEECVTKDPIRLRISSPNVPDLSLVDLPGYIQITTKDQPAKLKEKIGELCDYYITKPNIILAVSAADVDLANSEALRASKKVDPEGRRTIGVLTKMDLVDPEMGVKLLSNQDYHLPLGYIGVICRSLAQKGNKSQQEPDPESTFFTSHSLYENAAVGVPHLRQRLTTLLESRMVQSLSRVFKAVEAELEATRYRFKVEYNDRGWSPESYTLEAIDSLKHRLKEFVQDFDKARVKGVIQELLLDKVTEVSRQRAWKEGELPNSISKKVDMELLNRLIEAEAGMITKAGVGKLSVDQTVNLLLSSMQNITEQYPWTHHSSAKEKILQTAKDLLQSRVKLTVEQIENMIKPFKTTIDYSPSDWKNGQSVAAGLMDKELEKLNKELNELTTEAGKQTNGKRKLRCAIQYLQRTGSNTKENIPPPQDIPIIVETPTRNVELSEDLLAQGRKALSLENQIYFLRQRKRRLISSSCSSKALCPEVYLSIISDKLTYTSILFIYFELLNDFFASLPRALEQSLYHQVTQEGLESFARENPEVRKYLELQDKNEKLELIVNKLKAMM